MTFSLDKVGVVPGDGVRSVRVDHPLSLAYIGDAVWELYVRYHLLACGIVKPGDLQKESIRFVSAKAQAEALKRLMPELTEKERDIVRRGRNAKSKTTPKHADVHEYRHSTAVEALVGYLYLTDQVKRLSQIMEQVIDTVEKERKRADE